MLVRIRRGLNIPIAGAPEQRIFTGAWFVGLLIIGLVGMNLVIPRFFCRVLCPLGDFFGLGHGIVN